MFPSADVSTMFYKHPALLCEAQWPGVQVSLPPSPVQWPGVHSGEPPPLL